MLVLSEKSVEREIQSILAQHRNGLRGHRVLLFGSRARGEANNLADFNIGVDGDRPLDLATFFAIEAGINQMPTLYRVDWVDLNRVSPKLRENARIDGRILYEG